MNYLRWLPEILWFHTSPHPAEHPEKLCLSSTHHSAFCKLYDKARGLIIIGVRRTEPFQFGKGVHQACLLSPGPLILFREYMIGIVTEQIGGGQGMLMEQDLCGTSGMRMTRQVLYADDTTLIWRGRENLSKMAEAFRKESFIFGLRINNGKINVTKIRGQGDFTFQLEKLTEVKQSKFVGLCVTSNGDSTKEIETVLTIGRITAGNLTNIWRLSEINTRVQVSLAKYSVWYVAVYGY